MAVADDIKRATAIGAVTFGGVALIAPRLFTGLYGLPNEGNVRVMTRLWGTRTAAFGALLLMTDGGEAQRRMMLVGTAMNAADTVVAASGGGKVSVRGRVLGALTSAGFAGAGAYSLTQ